MPDTELDRRLTDWLDESAAPRAPDSLETAFIDGLAPTRQRPAWATTERWISMETRSRLGTAPRTAIILVTLALLTALAAGAIVTGSNSVQVPSPFGPASNGSLAYATGGQIWIASAEGDTVTQLTTDDVFKRYPAWSLDGTQLAYTSLQGETYGVVVANADGSDPIALASDLASDPGLARWKPDGSAVAFSEVDASLITNACIDEWSGVCGSRVWVAASDGSSLEQIGPADLDAAAPSWSPDGSTLALAGRVTDESVEAFGIYLMNADGSDVRRLGDVTGPPGRSLFWNPWSPDGTRIATPTIPNVIYVIDVESGEATEVTRGGHAAFPIWSRDGKELAVSNTGAGGVIIDENGEERAVGTLPVGFLHWSPDESMLIGVTEFQPEAVHFFDRDGQLMTSIETPGRGTGPADFQRLAP